MGIIRGKLAMLATALAVTVTGLAPVEAMPFAAPAVAMSERLPVIDAQYGNDRRDYRRNNDRREIRQDIRRDGYYNGHRGYRERRPGYRYQNGFWFPLAAFGAGAIIGGAMSQPQAQHVAPGRYTSGHVSWCQNRYKTYRAYDNTYVANSAGQRRLCNSPY
ncbi:BA14K family protein [Rhizobium sp. FY34]|uniref:BA14K family protein n=1 Tax=Rhizobium sp. FY34 TaxID=2562309 RepID=UPI0010C06D3D|nr:BA14K family protein [Rhizobium sp. FY34]